MNLLQRDKSGFKLPCISIKKGGGRRERKRRGGGEGRGDRKVTGNCCTWAPERLWDTSCFSDSSNVTENAISLHLIIYLHFIIISGCNYPHICVIYCSN
jgi:hypothetical protein